MPRVHLKGTPRQEERAFSPAVITRGGAHVWLAGVGECVDENGKSLAGDFDAQARATFRTLGRVMARRGRGPSLIEAITYRWLGHNYRDTEYYGGYRSKKEVEAWKKKCPIKRARERLLKMGVLTTERDEAFHAEARETVAEAVRFAKESPYPTREELLQGVWP